MGQNQIKAGLRVRLQAQSLADGLATRFKTVHELKSLSYDTFLHELELLNEITDELTRNTDKTILFNIKDGASHNFFWKATTRILCEKHNDPTLKVERETGVVLSTKVLSIKRFLRLYSDIMHQISAVSAARSNEQEIIPQDLCASMIMDGLDATSISSSTYQDSPNECCICMEKDCELILNCTHGFCEQCIETWQHTSNTPVPTNTTSTCPICRDPLEDTSNHWVLAEGDNSRLEEMPALVLGLVDKAEGRAIKPRPIRQVRTRPSTVPPSLSSSLPNIDRRDARRNTWNISSADSAPSDLNLQMTNTPEGFTLISHNAEASETPPYDDAN